MLVVEILGPLHGHFKEEDYEFPDVFDELADAGLGDVQQLDEFGGGEGEVFEHFGDHADFKVGVGVTLQIVTE